MGSEAGAGAGKRQVTEGEPGSWPCRAGVAAASAVRELTVDSYLGTAQREVPPPPPRQEGLGPGPQIRGIDQPRHYITGRDIFSKAGLAACFVKGEAVSTCGAHCHLFLPQGGHIPTPHGSSYLPLGCVPAMPNAALSSLPLILPSQVQMSPPL